MKTNTLLLSALLLTSCGGPAAMVTDKGGNEYLVEKVEPLGEPLFFRTASGTIELNLKTVGALTVSSSDVTVYGGDTWMASTVTFIDDTTATERHGWVKLNSRIAGICPVGDCELDLAKLANFDFIMAEEVIAGPLDTVSMEQEMTTPVETPTEVTPTE